MSRLALDEALKKPGRIMTWHAGWRNRSHKTSRREDYVTVLPREMAPFLNAIDSSTTVFEFLEQFLDEMLVDLLYDADMRPLDSVPEVLLELRGYFDTCMEFYVREVVPPAPPMLLEEHLRGHAVRRPRGPRWLILANLNVRSAARCGEIFDQLLDAGEAVSQRHNLRLDLEMARDRFRSMLRRRMEADGLAPDWALLDAVPFELVPRQRRASAGA